MANNLMRFEPFSDLVRFDPFHTIDELYKDLQMMPSWRTPAPEPRIRLDMAETDQAYIVKAEIPGVKKDDITVAIDGNRVSLAAQVQKQEEESSGTMMRSERYFGQQQRSFVLPQEVDDSNAQARYQDGILELTLPKKAGKTRKQLAIQ